MTAFLSFEDIVRQVERAGFVVRDAGLLASAIARPQASAFGVDAYPDLFDKAAALCHSIDNNQALVDGNKRLAWNATWFFLGVNGVPLADPLDEDAAQHLMLDLVRGRLTLPDIASGLQKFAA